MISDTELVARVALNGDPAAFTLLVERHQVPIRRYLRRLLVSDDATADDLAQDTFLAAHQKIASFKGTARFGTWLHSIAYRKFLDHQRKHGRVQPMAELPDDGVDERQAIDDEILARRLMAELGPEDRACMTMAYSAGMSHAEIARVVEQPLGSVKARIHRAKLKLQKWLEDNDHSLPDTKETTNGGPRHA